MVQTKRKLNNIELFLKLFHIQSKEIGTKEYHEGTTELENWQNEISPEYRGQKGRLKAECHKTTDNVSQRLTKFQLQEYNSSYC